MNNKPKTKLLTISLLCCGRPDTTERCLKSLMPLREAIDSEIQVVDTGCDKETRAVVEKYADEVFEFEWCNDFSKARNFQLDQANGKMFLYIDDDEFFLDCKALIDFFKQKNCTTYNIGGYYQRNYLDFEAREYQDTEVVRMCTVTPETYFKGKVHEFINPAYGNAIFLNSQAGHFGYLYRDPADNIKHSMRNIPLLKDMMEEDPEEFRWPYQLCQEYRAIKYYDELLELCKNGIDATNKSDEPEAILYKGTFVCGVAIALSELKRYDELFEFYEKEMADENLYEYPKAKISIYAAQGYFTKDMNDECIKACEYYINLMKKTENERQIMFLKGGIFVQDVFETTYVNTMYCYVMTAYMRKDDFSALVHYYRRINWDSPIMRLNRGFVATLIEKSMKLGYKKEIADVYNKMFGRFGIVSALDRIIEESISGMTLEQMENLKKGFKGTVGEHQMTLFIDIRMLEKIAITTNWTSYSELLDLFKIYSEESGEWYRIFSELLQKEEQEAILDKNPEVLLGEYLGEFIENADINPTKALEALRKALGNRIFMESPIQAMAKLYRNHQVLMDARKKDPAKFDEMYNLEMALRAQIETMEANGHSADAQTTRNQLESILKQSYGVTTILE